MGIYSAALSVGFILLAQNEAPWFVKAMGLLMVGIGYVGIVDLYQYLEQRVIFVESLLETIFEIEEIEEEDVD